MKAKCLLYALAAGCLPSGAALAGTDGDPHYTAAGFFDVHVCNWPEKPRFLMALFSTARYDEIARVTVHSPDGARLGDLDTRVYRAFKAPSGEAKRVFISHLDLPASAVDGWYRAEITLTDGSRFEARDYVVHHFMPQASGIRPVPGAQDVPASAELSWDPIPGARYYEVFLRNDWDDTPASASGLITQPRFKPPADALQSGGEYVWRIHARDSDGNVLLGDFNHGSLSPEMHFTVR